MNKSDSRNKSLMDQIRSAVSKKKLEDELSENNQKYQNYPDARDHQDFYDRRYLASSYLYDIYMLDEYVMLAFRKDPERKPVCIGHFWMPEVKDHCFGHIVSVEDENEVERDIAIIGGDGLIIYELTEPYESYDWQYEYQTSQWKEYGREPKKEWTISTMGPGLTNDQSYFHEVKHFFFLHYQKDKIVQKRVNLLTHEIKEVGQFSWDWYNNDG